MQGKKLPMAEPLWPMPVRLRMWLLKSLKKWAQWQSTLLRKRKAKCRKKEQQAHKLRMNKATSCAARVVQQGKSQRLVCNKSQG